MIMNEMNQMFSPSNPVIYYVAQQPTEYYPNVSVQLPLCLNTRNLMLPRKPISLFENDENFLKSV